MGAYPLTYLAIQIFLSNLSLDDENESIHQPITLPKFPARFTPLRADIPEGKRGSFKVTELRKPSLSTPSLYRRPYDLSTVTNEEHLLWARLQSWEKGKVPAFRTHDQAREGGA